MPILVDLIGAGAITTLFFAALRQTTASPPSQRYLWIITYNCSLESEYGFARIKNLGANSKVRLTAIFVHVSA
jgi:hypothetical protein